MSLFERLSGVVICRALTDLFLHDSSWRHINIRSSFPDESAKIKCAQPHSEGGQTVRVVPTAGLEEIELEGGYYNQHGIRVFFQYQCYVRAYLCQQEGDDEVFR